MFELFIIIALILIIGTIYQFVSVKLDKRRYRPLGEMIKIDHGGFLHVVYKKIFEDRPTIILEAGNGLSSSAWMLVQPEIEKFANCLSYDRAGFGWSQQKTSSNTSLDHVNNLRNLLSKLNLPKPYIFVGHSYGGLLNLLYASKYPNETAGIILVDAYHYDQLKIIPPPSLMTMKVLGIILYLGIFRIFINKLFFLPKTIPSTMKKRIHAEITAYSWIRSVRNVFFNIEKNIKPLKNIPILNIPLAIISAGLHTGKEQKYKQRICELQKDFLKKSSKSYQVIAERSGHNIPFSEPELIVATVKKILIQHN